MFGDCTLHLSLGFHLVSSDYRRKKTTDDTSSLKNKWNLQEEREMKIIQVTWSIRPQKITVSHQTQGNA